MSEMAQAWKAKLQPLAGARWPLRCGFVIPPGDLERLQAGLWPRDMDDRWAIWLDGDTLRCWRSWTAICIYEARLDLNSDGSARAVMLDVLDNPVAYVRATSEEAELHRFEGVLALIRQVRGELGSVTRLPVA